MFTDNVVTVGISDGQIKIAHGNDGSGQHS